MNARHCLFFLLTALTLSCQPGEPGPGGVALHLITSPANLGANATALDSVPITLASDAFIRYDQIERYSANTYTFRLKAGVADQLRKLSKEVPLSGKPFAVVVDRTVVYYGLFWNPYSSFNAVYPRITLDADSLSRSTSSIDLPVDFRTPFPGGVARQDLRNDARLLNRLRRDNKLMP